MTDEVKEVCIKDRMERFMYRLEIVEGRYTDANIIVLALRRIDELEARVRELEGLRAGIREISSYD